MKRHADVLRDVQGEGGLPHARSTGDDHEVGRLQTRRLQIELLEARRHAGDVLFPLVEPLDVLERVLENLAHRQGAAFEPALGEPEDLPLGVVDEGLHILLGLEGLTDDLRRGLDELAQDGHVTHDAGVGREMGGDRRVLDEERQRPRTADGFQRAVTAEVLAQRDEIDARCGRTVLASSRRSSGVRRYRNRRTAATR